MKRVLSLVLVLCVAATLFAATGLSVKAGGAFDFFSMKTAKSDDKEVAYTFSGNGLGFEVGIQYDINDKIQAYADYSMVFPSDFTMTPDKSGFAKGTFKEIFVEEAEAEAEAFPDGKASHSIIFLNISAGAAYKFDFDAVKLAVGGGIYYNLLLGTARCTGTDPVLGKQDIKDVASFYTIGLSGLVDAKYMVADNIGIYLTAIPQIGFYSRRSFDTYVNGVREDYDRTLSGFGVSFTMPISIGASYSF